MKTEKSLSPRIRGIETMMLILVFILSACVNNVPGDDDSPLPDTDEVTVHINTRTDAEGIPPVYPVRIYAFDTEGTCKANQTIESADDDIALTLTAGTYTVYALAGATTTRYNIPAANTIAPTTVIPTLVADGLHDELQTAHANITLTNGETTNLSLTVGRRIAGINAEITNLPADATAVAVTVQPLYPAINLSGDYLDTASEPTSATIDLTSEAPEQGNWATEATAFVLPGTDKATITIAITTAQGTQTYAYNTNITINPAYQINIEATYTAGAPQLQGTLTGTDWEGTETVSFDFGPGATDEEPEPSEPTEPSGDVPSPGTLYKDCYVLSVTTTPTAAQVVLLAPHETTITGTTASPAPTQIADYLATYTHQGITNWQLPNTQQATLIYTNYSTINKALKAAGKLPMDDAEYIFRDSSTQNIRTFSKSESPANADAKIYDKGTYNLRPVATIEI